MGHNKSLFAILLLLATLTYYNLSPANAAPPWQFERPIEILNNGNALVDHQVLVTLSDSTFDYSQANPDGSDLRFTDDTKTVFYGYWIEEWNPSGDSKIWVKVPSIPNGASIMYMWHGNTGASSQSNGGTTFDFFDNFDDGDISDWSKSCESEDITGESCDYFADNTTYMSEQYSLSLYGWSSCGGPTYNGIRPTVYRDLVLADGSYKLEFFEKGWGGQWGYCSSGHAGDNLAYSDSTTIYSSTTCHYSGCGRCSTSWTNAASDIFNVSGGSVTIKITTNVTDCEEGEGWFDDVRIRKCASPEPTAVLLYSLTLSAAGAGNGTVTSTPTGIDCGSDCFENYPAGTTVTLSAVPDFYSSFAGWSGDGCSGSGACTITMDSDKMVTATFSGTPQDNDDDGVSDPDEGGPNRDNPCYDGNGDGTPDRLQENVASFVTYAEDGNHYITLETPSNQRFVYAYALRDFDTPPPSGVNLPYGLFTFMVSGIEKGGGTTVTIYPDGPLPQTYYKYGKTPDISQDHWYEFIYDGTAGAEKAGDAIVLHLVDGGLGDHDLTANKNITDPGGPALTETKEVLYFPHMVIGTGEETDLEIINAEVYDVTANIAYYQEDGEILAQEGITLGPKGKATISAGNIPSGATTAAVTADGKLIGHTLYINALGKRCIWSASTSGATLLSVAHVATDNEWRTGLALANLTDGEVTVTVTCEGESTSELSLPARSHSFWWLAEAEKIISLDATGKIGAVEIFESLVSSGDMAALLLERNYLNSLYIPHIYHGQDMFTGVGIINGSYRSTAYALAYRESGQIEQLSLGETEPRSSAAFNLSGLCPDDTLWAEITGETDVSTPFGILSAYYQGLAIYGEENAALLGAINLNTLRFREGVLGLVASDPEPDFAFVNPADEGATLLITAHGAGGAVLANSTLYVGAKQSISGTLGVLLEDISLDGITHIWIESDTNLYGFQRVYAAGRMEMLPVLRVE
jgi:hypothetical protein